LSSTKNNVVLYWGDGRGVEGCVCNVGLEHIELFDVNKLCGLVLAGSYEVCSVGSPLNIGFILLVLL
jgi:hypothetical protein